jgi:hypothetical protein
VIINTKAERIDNGIKASIPSQDLIVVEKRLLDGTIHTQTIGKPIPLYEVEIYISDDNVPKLLSAASTKEPLTYNRDGKIQTVKIRETPQFRIHKQNPPRLYIASFIFIVEGAV